MSSRFKYCKPPRFDLRKYQWRPMLKETHQQVNQTMDHLKHQQYMRRMVLQQQQEQETNNKKNQEKGGSNNTNTNNNNFVERRTTVGGGAAAAKANAVDNANSRLISFLEKDESFFTPWSWDPNNNASGSLNQREEKTTINFNVGRFSIER
ncbi:hypothetical protein PIB30_008803 [Stylosanthes scabra]|uniref:Uncharacterized protein n=1 Tax=Stylosanthes scabra TaxID=79078 RepID=A0ABU6X356_9FABA|nr:hypothetical protein [Stylosanthes scabra]